MLFVRALIAFLVLPGTMAGLLPWMIVSQDSSRHDGWRAGAVVLGAGVCILLWCVRDFYVAGKGTLAPWDPPKALVRIGLYRFVRNPMYVGVLAILAGWTLFTGSRALGAYTIFMALAFHLRVLLYEEPRLDRQFDAQWKRYRANVRRWIPRLTPWSDAP